MILHVYLVSPVGFALSVHVVCNILVYATESCTANVLHYLFSLCWHPSVTDVARHGLGTETY